MIRVVTLLIILFFTSNIFGDELTISISNKNNNKIEPGKNITFPITIEKSISSYAKIYLEAVLPEGWTYILDQKPVILSPGSTAIRLINIKIPTNAKSGNFDINIIAIDSKTKNKLAETSTSLGISEKVGLDINIIDVPDYIKSGENIRSKVVMKSSSNKEISVRLLPRNCAINGEDIFLLQPGENKIVDISFIPLAEVNTVNNFAFGVNALVAGNDTLNFSTSEYVKVIPSEFHPVDDRFRYPIYFKASYLSRYFEEGFKHAFQGEVYGVGQLGRNSNNFLEFRLRGPNTYELSSLGSVDEYFIKFNNKKLSAVVGDNIYTVTPLVEPGRYARGAGVAGRIGNLELKAYYNQPRFYPDVKQTFSGSVSYIFKDKYKLGVHYMAKDYSSVNGIAQIGSISGEFEPVQFTKIFVEYSHSQFLGNDGNGIYGSISSRFWRINLSGYITYADQYYTGYYNNTLSYNSNININIYKGLSFNANFRRDERNAARDTLYGTAPYTISYRAGLNWMITRLSSLKGYGGYREREDRMPVQKFHYEEYYGRLDYDQIIKKFALKLSGELAQTTNFLLTTNNKAPSYGAFLDLGFRPKNNINITAFGSYRLDNRYSESSTSKLYYGVSLDAYFSRKSHLYFRFQNAYALEEYYRDRDFFTLMFNQLIGRHQEISVRVQYGMLQNDLESIDLSVELSYIYHIGVPIGKKKNNYGKVRGNIKNLGVKSVEGIILHLNSYTEMTDAQGNFVFEEVLPGSYYLIIDKSSVDFQDITDRPMPVRLDVTEQNETYVELGMTRSGVIDGQIVMKDGKPLPSEVSKIVIELKRGQEVVKSITDENGKFRFSGVRPGIWELVIHDEGLHSAYYFEEKEFEFDIEAGENINLPVELYTKKKVIKLKPNKMRIIQMQ